MPFNPGDVVVLKSGGPKMTVRRPEVDQAYLCEWFEGTRAIEKVFLSEQLASFVAPPRYRVATFKSGF